jgi:predicted O-methyltransferase YrrM
MDFVPEKINNYAEIHTTEENELLADLNRATWTKVLQPRMLSGHIQGRLLSMFSKMIKPNRILEIGTYTGYSALCLAEGLAKDGELHTIDKNEELSHLMNSYFDKSSFKKNIKSHIGNALEIIPTMDEHWDLVFIDADKENYINYYNLLIDKMNPDSFIIADNVLWSGKVVDDSSEFDEETKILDEFNKMIQEDNRLENILLPIRDGLMVARVK